MGITWQCLQCDEDQDNTKGIQECGKCGQFYLVYEDGIELQSGNSKHSRTLEVVKQLSQGKHLTLEGFGTIAMGWDMSIGILMDNYRIGGLSTMDLRDLNKLLDKHDIKGIL